MAKYEIMLMLNGSLSEVDARVGSEKILALFENLPDYDLQTIWSDELAYPINKVTVAHRFILNFSLSDPLVLQQFREMAALNKNVIRHLIINIEKDYGYKAKNNPKKVKAAEIKQEKYQKYLVFKSKRLKEFQK